MKHGCPNKSCTFYQKTTSISGDGSYFRKNDSRQIKRYRCRHCGKRFSTASFSLAKGQKKRRVNFQLFHLLSSGMTMRRAAKHLKIHRTTVKRKMLFLANKAEINHRKFLQSLVKNKVEHIQFDDLITTEHTKMKPLSITLAVDAKSRKILATEVSQIPAFGHLAEISRAKYGYRESYHQNGLQKLFENIESAVSPVALIESDEHNNYPNFVNSFFPKAKHKRHKGGRGCIVGQGELKKLFYDPLFILNHTCAMLRANISRLVRKTWNTTKDPRMLSAHLAIFMHYYNTYYL